VHERSSLSEIPLVFFHSTFISVDGAKQFLKELEQKNFYVVYFIEDDNVESRVLEMQRKDKYHFGFVAIDFLRILVRDTMPFENEESVSALINNIKDQRARHLWASIPNDIGFRDEIVAAINEGALLKVVLERNSTGAETPTSLTGKALLQGSPLIRQIVLFVATFFPRINVSSFTLVVGTIAKAIPNDHQNQIQEGTTKPKTLFEEWQWKADLHTSECFLFLDKGVGGEGQYTFRHGNLRPELKIAFEETFPLLVQQFLEIFFDSEILYATTTSRELFGNAVQFAARLTASDPQGFGNPFFFAFLNRIQAWEKRGREEAPNLFSMQRAATDANGQMQTMGEVTNSDIANRPRKETTKHHWLLRRFAWWMNEVMLYPNSRIHIQEYLEHLFKHEERRSILVRLVPLLGNASIEEIIKWIEKILSIPDGEDEQLALNALFELSWDESKNIFQILRLVSRWWKANHQQSTKSSILHSEGLLFLFKYSKMMFEKRDDGLENIKIPFSLFDKRNFEFQSDPEPLKFIVEWSANVRLESAISHAILGETPRGSLELMNGAANLFRADMLADWFWILCGPSLALDSGDDDMVSGGKLLELVVEIYDNRMLSGIVSSWKHLADLANQKIAMSNRLDATIGRTELDIGSIKEKRDFHWQLAKRVNDYRNNSSKS
jgi:hypothetical protein